MKLIFAIRFTHSFDIGKDERLWHQLVGNKTQTQKI